jgi:hypothetical protein
MIAGFTKKKPFYATDLGAAYLGDARDLLGDLPDESVNLIVTSPPYALHFKKEYGNVEKHEYVSWFLGFARHFHRVLTTDGSLVIDIGGSYNEGQPTRSLYHFQLLITLCEELKFHLAQEFFWYNPAKLPSPAEWVRILSSVCGGCQRTHFPRQTIARSCANTAQICSVSSNGDTKPSDAPPGTISPINSART